MKGIKNAGGIIFDIYEDQFDRYLDNFDHIAEQEGNHLPFILDRCPELPELTEDETGQGWRNNDPYDGSYSQNYGGGRSGGRGGYDGNRGSRGGRGGGFN
jgi:uncharacterized membrane protein YgcG